MISLDIEELIDDIARLVGCESPTNDVDACRAAAVDCVSIARRLVPWASADIVETSGRPNVVVRSPGASRLLILGHLDTVWPLGTTAQRPFTRTGNVLSGPGVFDMKAGLMVALHALRAVGPLDGVTVLITSDEEVGSDASADLVVELAVTCGAVLVLEPPVDGPHGIVKTARKGVGFYRLEVEGRAAHAGLNPHDGVNALLALAELLPVVARLADPSRGTTVTPTVASAGSAVNVVPARAVADIDVRVAEPDEAARVDQAMRALRLADPNARLAVSGGPNRPPLPASASHSLLAVARDVADRFGLSPVTGAAVGGGSDGNLVAAAGVPVLDGLGPPGGGAHTIDEHVLVDRLIERTTLVARLVERLAR